MWHIRSLNQRTPALLVLLIAACTTQLGMANSAAQKPKSHAQVDREALASLRPTRIFDSVRATLSKNTRVPLRLPDLLLEGGDELVAVVVTAKPSMFEIML